MDILQDRRIVVAVKPSGVLSTDEPGGMPALLRQALHTACVRTVHRLDAPVSGLMVCARSAYAAGESFHGRSGRGSLRRNTWRWCGACRPPEGHDDRPAGPGQGWKAA